MGQSEKGRSVKSFFSGRRDRAKTMLLWLDSEWNVHRFYVQSVQKVCVQIQRYVKKIQVQNSLEMMYKSMIQNVSPNLVPLTHFIKWNYLLSTFREGCIICLSVKWTKTSTFSTPPIVESLTYYTTHYPLLVALLLSCLLFGGLLKANIYTFCHNELLQLASPKYD